MDSELERLRATSGLQALPPPPRRPGLWGAPLAWIKRLLRRPARAALAAELQAIERHQLGLLDHLEARAQSEHQSWIATLDHLAGRFERLEQRLEQVGARLEASAGERAEAVESRLAAQLSKLAAEVEEALEASRRLGDVYRELFVSTESERERLRRAAARLETAEAPGTGGAAGAMAWLEAREYRRFAGRFRGDPAEIQARLSEYVRLLADQAPVLDAGCGRGEFLDLLQAAGRPAYGIDLNPEFAACGRARGLDVREQGVLEHLAALEPGSLGGILCAQVLEHLGAAEVRRFVELAFRALRAGGLLIAETIHPGSPYAFSHAYVLDLSHRTPIHPEALRLVLEACGFARVEIRLRSPVPEIERLELVPESAGGWARALNRNLAKLNAFLYAPQEYAAVARK
ncbi:MAG TPA: methyltransferase domain-containing protein [Acidobacteriota bacterium]